MSQAMSERCGFEVAVIDGLPFARLPEESVAQLIAREASEYRGGWVITPNVDLLHLKRMDARFAGLLEQADILVADGAPLVWASRIAGHPLPGRVCGSDLLLSVSHHAALMGLSVFLLGGAPGAADRAAEVLLSTIPGIRIAGTHCPDFGFEHDERQLSEIRSLLRERSPSIVFVALGAPKQEYLIEDIRGLLPAAWWLGIGASFSMLAGDVVRAPRWVGVLGMEWLWRLAQEPRRLFRRYVIDDVPVALAILLGAVRARLND